MNNLLTCRVTHAGGLPQPPADDPDAEGCLLDAFCEDEGLAFAKLDEIERRIGEMESLGRTIDREL